MRDEMKVHIKEKLFSYTSDFPQGWVFAKGDYFKKVNIDKYACFVKRFEVKTPESLSAWQLLSDLKGKYEANLARLFDIAVTKENGRNIYYLFYEFIEGDTLHKLVADDVDVDLERLTANLFSGIAALQNRGYWFPDFVEKNIYFDNKGTFVLIDLDSAHPLSEAPNHDMWADKEYWALIFNFYKEVLGREQLTYSDLHGINLNYLIIIFLILRLKIHQSGRTKEFQSLFNDLPVQLDRVSKSFRKIFEAVFQKQTAITSDLISEIRNLIETRILSLTDQAITGLIEGSPDPVEPPPLLETVDSKEELKPVIHSFSAVGYDNRIGNDQYEMNKITSYSLVWETGNASTVELYKDGILFKKMLAGEERLKFADGVDARDKELKYTLKVYNNSSVEQSKSLIVKFTAPNIRSFTASKQHVKIGEIFTLRWDVQHATNIELFRNGVLYKTFGRAENHLQLKEELFDSTNPEIDYVLEASDGHSNIKSEPVVIMVKASKLRPSLSRISIGAVSFVLLAWLIYFFTWHKKTEDLVTKIDPFTSDQITQNSTITITGKNLPLAKESVQVVFANIKGNILRQTKDSLLVQVPAVEKSNGATDIMVLVNGALFKAADHVRYMLASSQNIDSPGLMENLIDKIRPSLIQHQNGNIKLQLENGSSRDLDKVIVIVSYLSTINDGSTGNRLLSPKNESLIFTGIQAGARMELDAPYLEHASEVEVRIKSIDIRRA